MRLIIDGTPIAQIRMKYSGRNGIGRIYDPREKDKKRLKAFIASEWTNHPYFIHPRVSFIFHMPIPISIPKRLLPLYNSGLLKHEKKPDTDNFIKLYLDCMDEICFEGDQKVSLGNCVKLYHPHPKTIIIINETSQKLSPLEVDPATWYYLHAQESDKQSSSEMDFLHDSYTPTELKYSLSPDMIYPQQIIPSLNLVHSVPRILEQEYPVSSQFHHPL